jgi:ABC-type uncharacterized transport system fused permease/ATPase subunit
MEWLWAVLRLVLQPVWSWRSAAPALLLAVSAGYELCGLLVMDIVASFYLAIVSSDRAYYTSSLLKAVGVVSLIAVLKTLQTLLQDACALQWRLSLVAALHRQYSLSPYAPIPQAPLADPDQRLTQDAERLTTTAASVLPALVLKPLVAAWFTGYLYLSFHWSVPALCYAYFAGGLLVSWLLSAPLAVAVARQEALEGALRYQHALHHALPLQPPQHQCRVLLMQIARARGLGDGRGSSGRQRGALGRRGREGGPRPCLWRGRAQAEAEAAPSIP